MTRDRGFLDHWSSINERQAIKLLKEAVDAINSELESIGSDEWPKHPHLKAKGKLCGRIEKFIKERS